HRERAREWTGPMRERRAREEKHPVLDFLNTYYQLSLGKLEAWHPGPGVRLEDCPEARRQFSSRHYRFAGGWCALDPSRLEEKARRRLQFMIRLLRATDDRPPNFACHGLHEWAMVYRGTMVRHRETVPFRCDFRRKRSIGWSNPAAFVALTSTPSDFSLRRRNR
ncbi:MAG: hypothetical protein GWO24_29215, partial [Akkermansiaceae bacterium]|nr:hypothetical protein [Akkermansiaceae bacterium]